MSKSPYQSNATAARHRAPLSAASPSVTAEHRAPYSAGLSFRYCSAPAPSQRRLLLPLLLGTRPLTAPASLSVTALLVHFVCLHHSLH